MKILAIDKKYMSSALQLMSVDSWSTELKPETTITCQLSKLQESDLKDNDLYIRLRNGLMVKVPYRTHKKRRIQKKWVKRYGMRYMTGYTELLYKVHSVEMNSYEDYVTFYCYLDRSRKYTSY